MLERAVVSLVAQYVGQFVEGGLERQNLGLAFGRSNALELRSVRLDAERVRDLLRQLGAPLSVRSASLGHLRVDVNVQGQVKVDVADLQVVLALQEVDTDKWTESGLKRYQRTVLLWDNKQRLERMRAALARRDDQEEVKSATESSPPSWQGIGSLANAWSGSPGGTTRDWSFFGSGYVERMIGYVTDRLHIRVRNVVIALEDALPKSRREAEAGEPGYAWRTGVLLESLHTADWEANTTDVPADEAPTRPVQAIVARKLLLHGVRLFWEPFDATRQADDTSAWKRPSPDFAHLQACVQQGGGTVLGPSALELAVGVAGFQSAFQTTLEVHLRDIALQISKRQYSDMLSAAFRAGLGKGGDTLIGALVFMSHEAQLQELAARHRPLLHAHTGEPPAQRRLRFALRCARDVARRALQQRSMQRVLEHIRQRRVYARTYILAHFADDLRAQKRLRQMEASMPLEEVLTMRAHAERVLTDSGDVVVALERLLVPTVLPMAVRQQRWAMLAVHWVLRTLIGVLVRLLHVASGLTSGRAVQRLTRFIDAHRHRLRPPRGGADGDAATSSHQRVREPTAAMRALYRQVASTVASDFTTYARHFGAAPTVASGATHTAGALLQLRVRLPAVTLRALAAPTSLVMAARLQRLAFDLAVLPDNTLKMSACGETIRVVDAEQQVMVENRTISESSAADSQLQFRLQLPVNGPLELYLGFWPLSVYATRGRILGLLRFWIPETLLRYAEVGREYTAEMLNQVQMQLGEVVDSGLWLNPPPTMVSLHFGALQVHLEDYAGGGGEADSVVRVESPAAMAAGEHLVAEVGELHIYAGDAITLAPLRERTDHDALVSGAAFGEIRERAARAYEAERALAGGDDDDDRVTKGRDAATDDNFEDPYASLHFHTRSVVLIRFSGVQVGSCCTATLDRPSRHRDIVRLDSVVLGVASELGRGGHLDAVAAARANLSIRVGHVIASVAASDILKLARIVLSYASLGREVQSILLGSVATPTSDTSETEASTLMPVLAAVDAVGGGQGLMSTRSPSKSLAAAAAESGAVPDLLAYIRQVRDTSLAQKRSAIRAGSSRFVEHPLALRLGLSVAVVGGIQAALVLDVADETCRGNLYGQPCVSARLMAQCDLAVLNNQAMMVDVAVGGISSRVGEASADAEERLLLAPFAAVGNVFVSPSNATTNRRHIAADMECEPIDVILPLGVVTEVRDRLLAFARRAQTELQRQEAAAGGSTSTVSLPRSSKADLPADTSAESIESSHEDTAAASIDENRYEMVTPRHGALVLLHMGGPSCGAFVGVDVVDGTMQAPCPLEQAVRFRVLHARDIRETGRFALQAEAEDAAVNGRLVADVGDAATTDGNERRSATTTTTSSSSSSSSALRLVSAPLHPDQLTHGDSGTTTDSMAMRTPSAQQTPPSGAIFWEVLRPATVSAGVLLRNCQTGRLIGGCATWEAVAAGEENERQPLEAVSSVVSACALRLMTERRARAVSRSRLRTQVGVRFHLEGAMLRLTDIGEPPVRAENPLLAFTAAPVTLDAWMRQRSRTDELDVDLSVQAQVAIDTYQVLQCLWYPILEPLPLTVSVASRGRHRTLLADLQVGGRGRGMNLNVGPAELGRLSAVGAEIALPVSRKRGLYGAFALHNESEFCVALRYDDEAGAPQSAHAGQVVALRPPMLQRQSSLVRWRDVAGRPGKQTLTGVRRNQIANVVMEVGGYGALPTFPVDAEDVVRLGLPTGAAGSAAVSTATDSAREMTTTTTTTMSAAERSPSSTAAVSATSEPTLTRRIPSGAFSGAATTKTPERAASRGRALSWLRQSDGFRHHFYLYSKVKLTNTSRTVALDALGLLDIPSSTSTTMLSLDRLRHAHCQHGSGTGARTLKTAESTPPITTTTTAARHRTFPWFGRRPHRDTDGRDSKTARPSSPSPSTPSGDGELWIPLPCGDVARGTVGHLAPGDSAYFGTVFCPKRVRLQCSGAEQCVSFAALSRPGKSGKSYLVARGATAATPATVLNVRYAPGERFVTEYTVGPPLTLVSALPCTARLQVRLATSATAAPSASPSPPPLLLECPFTSGQWVELFEFDVRGRPHTVSLSLDDGQSWLVLATVSFAPDRSDRNAVDMALHLAAKQTLISPDGCFRVKRLHVPLRGALLYVYAPYLLYNAVRGVDVQVEYADRRQRWMMHRGAKSMRSATKGVMRRAARAIGRVFGGRRRPTGDDVDDEDKASGEEPRDGEALASETPDTLSVASGRSSSDEADGAEAIEMASGSDAEATTTASPGGTPSTLTPASSAQLSLVAAASTKSASQTAAKYLLPAATRASGALTPTANSARAPLLMWRSEYAVLSTARCRKGGQLVRLAPLPQGNPGFAIPAERRHHQLELVTEMGVDDRLSAEGIPRTLLPLVHTVHLCLRFEMVNLTEEDIWLIDALDYELQRKGGEDTAIEGERGDAATTAPCPGDRLPVGVFLPPSRGRGQPFTFHVGNRHRQLRLRFGNTGWSGLIDATSLAPTSAMLPPRRSTANTASSSLQVASAYRSMYFDAQTSGKRIFCRFLGTPLPGTTILVVNRTGVRLVVCQKRRHQHGVPVEEAVSPRSSDTESPGGLSEVPLDVLRRVRRMASGSPTRSLALAVMPRSQSVFTWPEPLGSARVHVSAGKQAVEAMVAAAAAAVDGDAEPASDAKHVTVDTRKLSMQPLRARLAGREMLLRMGADGPQRYLLVEEVQSSDSPTTTPVEVERARFDYLQPINMSRLRLYVALPRLSLLLRDRQAWGVLQLQLQGLQAGVEVGVRGEVECALLVADVAVNNRVPESGVDVMLAGAPRKRGNVSSSTSSPQPPPPPSSSSSSATTSVGAVRPTTPSTPFAQLTFGSCTRERLLYVRSLQTAVERVSLVLDTQIVWRVAAVAVQVLDELQSMMGTDVVLLQRTTAPPDAEAADGVGSASSRSRRSIAGMFAEDRVVAVYVNAGAVDDVDCVFTWRPASLPHRHELGALEHRANEALMQRLRFALAYVPRVTNAVVSLPSIALHEHFSTMRQLQRQVVQHYTWAALRNWHMLVGSLDMLGAPMNVWGTASERAKHVGKQLRELHLASAGKGIVTGLGGTALDVGQSFAGAVTAVSGMAYAKATRNRVWKALSRPMAASSSGGAGSSGGRSARGARSTARYRSGASSPSGDSGASPPTTPTAALSAGVLGSSSRPGAGAAQKQEARTPERSGVDDDNNKDELNKRPSLRSALLGVTESACPTATQWEARARLGGAGRLVGGTTPASSDADVAASDHDSTRS